MMRGIMTVIMIYYCLIIMFVGKIFFKTQKSRKCGIKFVRVGQVVLRLLERTELVSE